jgi:hypothetical protein
MHVKVSLNHILPLVKRALSTPSGSRVYQKLRRILQNIPSQETVTSARYKHVRAWNMIEKKEGD